MRLRGLSIRRVRVNKGSLRTVTDDVGIAWPGPHRCPECGTRTDATTEAVRHALDAESLSQVNAYRARRGWPEIAA